MHAAGRSPLLPRGVAGVSGYSPSKERRHAVDALKSPACLEMRSQTMRYVVGAATWAGALRAAVDGLAACGWYCRHARGAKLVQIALCLNGHYGAGCCVRRALHVACVDQESPWLLVPSVDLLCIWAHLMGLSSGFACSRAGGAQTARLWRL